MHVTKEKLFGYDFVYSETGREQLHKSVAGKEGNYTFTLEKKHEENTTGFTDLLGSAPGINKQVYGYNKQGNLSVYAEYF